MCRQVEAQLAKSAFSRAYICQSWPYLEHHGFSFDPFVLTISEQESLAQFFRFLIIRGNHHSNEQITHKKCSKNDIRDKEKSHERLCLVPWHFIRPIAIHNRVHDYRPVHSLTHNYHLYHRVTNIVEVVVISFPLAPVIETILPGVNP